MGLKPKKKADKKGGAMRCPYCKTEMLSGFVLKSDLDGNMTVQPGQQKELAPQVYLCGNCGKIEMFLNRRGLSLLPK